MNRLKRSSGLIYSLRLVKTVWTEVYTRRTETSIEAATARCKKVSTALDKALKAGATNAMIYKAMDEALRIATNRRKVRK